MDFIAVDLNCNITDGEHDGSPYLNAKPLYPLYEPTRRIIGKNLFAVEGKQQGFAEF